MTAAKRSSASTDNEQSDFSFLGKNGFQVEDTTRDDCKSSRLLVIVGEESSITLYSVKLLGWT